MELAFLALVAQVMLRMHDHGAVFGQDRSCLATPQIDRLVVQSAGRQKSVFTVSPELAATADALIAMRAPTIVLDGWSSPTAQVHGFAIERDGAVRLLENPEPSTSMRILRTVTLGPASVLAIGPAPVAAQRHDELLKPTGIAFQIVNEKGVIIHWESDAVQEAWSDGSVSNAVLSAPSEAVFAIGGIASRARPTVLSLIRVSDSTIERVTLDSTLAFATRLVKVGARIAVIWKGSTRSGGGIHLYGRWLDARSLRPVSAAQRLVAERPGVEIGNFEVFNDSRRVHLAWSSTQTLDGAPETILSSGEWREGEQFTHRRIDIFRWNEPRFRPILATELGATAGLLVTDQENGRIARISASNSRASLTQLAMIDGLIGDATGWIRGDTLEVLISRQPTHQAPPRMFRYRWSANCR